MNRILLSTTLTLVAVPFVLHGQDLSENLNRWSFGPTFGMNFKANFRTAPSANAGPAAGGANHTYDDGYVLVDSSGNAGGLTWNWGYPHLSQVAGDTMQFHSVQPSSPSKVTGDPQFGGEVLYQRFVGHLPFGMHGRWGLEAGFGFTDIDLREDRNGTALVTTDTYSLNGVVPPGAGYHGTFQGPGALLGDTPTRTTESADLTSRQRLTGHMFSLRLGPFAEWNLTSKLSFDASVGLTLAPTTIDYHFSETATLVGGTTFSDSGHSSKTKLLYGPAAGGRLRYAFGKSWGIYVGAQVQSLTDLEQSVHGHTARFNPGFTINGSAGASFSF